MVSIKQIVDEIQFHDSDAAVVVPLNCDRVVASSLLQKAIRRSEMKLAHRAACTLLELDKDSIWRRFIVIAFEDVGAGGIAAVLETVSVAMSSEWRRAIGELAAVGFLVRWLAEAAKDRSADYLACAAKDHTALSETRDFCRKAALGQLLEFLADTSQPLAKRAVAACFASGIDWQSDRQVQERGLQAVAATYHQLGADEDVVSSMLHAAKRAREVIIALLPLIWLEVQRGGPASLRNDPVPSARTIAGVPLYAFDKHTRLGKRAIERLVRENKSIRDCIIRFLAKGSPIKAAEIAAFYADAAPVARRLDWTRSDALEKLGMEADFIAAGLRLEGIAPVRETMDGALEQLNEIRAELWTQAAVRG
jgi:hypothetical protein